MGNENVTVSIIDHKNGTLEWNVSIVDTDVCKDCKTTLICEGVKVSSVLIASICLLAIKKLNNSPHKGENGYWRNWSAATLAGIVHGAFLAASFTSFIQQSATGSGEDSISDLFNKIAASNMALHGIQVATNGFHFHTKHFTSKKQYQPVMLENKDTIPPNTEMVKDSEARWWLQGMREKMGSLSKYFGPGINRSVVVLQPVLSAFNVFLSLKECSETTRNYRGFYDN